MLNNPVSNRHIRLLLKASLAIRRVIYINSSLSKNTKSKFRNHLMTMKKANFLVPFFIFLFFGSRFSGVVSAGDKNALAASFVFGDSLVDAGNNNYLQTLSRANSPPNGIDFKPSRGNPTGRFTNGRTIADIVGK